MKARVLWVIALQIMLGLGILLMGACTPPVPQYPPPDDRDDRDVRRIRDDNREREIDRRRKTGECADDEDCQEICDDIFTARKDREECEEYSIDDIEAIEAVFEVLEDPDTEDLEDMDLKDLEFLLDISPTPLEKAVSRMNSSSERKDFLAWLATNDEAADIVAGAEDDFGIIKDLFGSSPSSILSELNRTVDSGDNFVEIALDEGNEAALEWLHDFFGDDCENETYYEKCIFKRFYCGLNLSGDFEEEYFDHEFFEDMLDEILESDYANRVGSPSWWEGTGNSGETETGDLDSWQSTPHDVCAAVNTTFS